MLSEAMAQTATLSRACVSDDLEFGEVSIASTASLPFSQGQYTQLGWPTFLEDQYQLSATVDGDHLDQLLKARRNFPHNFWTFPVLTSLPTWPFISGLLSLYALAVLAFVRNWLLAPQRPASSTYRFSAYWEDENPGVHLLDHLEKIYARTACGTLGPQHFQWSIDNNSLVITLNESNEMLGMGWNSSDVEANRLLSAVRWIVHEKNDDWKEVQSFNSPCLRWTLRLSEDANGVEFDWGVRGLVAFRIGVLLAVSTVVVGFSITLYLCAKGKIIHAKRSLACTFGTVTLIMLTSSMVLFADGAPGLALSPLLLFVPQAAVSLCLAVAGFEKHFGHVAATAGAFGLLLEILLVIVGQGRMCEFDSIKTRLSKMSLYVNFVLGTIGLWMVVSRRQRMRAVRQSQRDQIQRVESRWAELICDDETMASLQRLAARAAPLASGRPQQRFRGDGVSAVPLEAEDGGVVVERLSQLYAQAAACQRLLRDKVRSPGRRAREAWEGGARENGAREEGETGVCAERSGSEGGGRREEGGSVKHLGIGKPPPHVLRALLGPRVHATEGCVVPAHGSTCAAPDVPARGRSWGWGQCMAACSRSRPSAALPLTASRSPGEQGEERGRSKGGAGGGARGSEGASAGAAQGGGQAFWGPRPPALTRERVRRRWWRVQSWRSGRSCCPPSSGRSSSPQTACAADPSGLVRGGERRRWGETVRPGWRREESE